MSSADTPSIGPLDPRDATPLPLEPGDVVADRYEILRLLGSGGSAHVYAVRDRRIGDEIALKLLRPEKRSEIDVRRSQREAEYARGSASPRLVRTFDLVEADGFLFLTMELVSEESLRDVIRRGPLSIDEVIRLAHEIVQALLDLHSFDIVHRDLKPANLLMTRDGHVKLSDFGIARRWTEDAVRLTRTGLPVGTIDYLSPEQARGDPVDPRSDLYSLGVVLFELLTGQVPFHAATPVGSIVKRLQHDAADVRTLRRDTPRWLARFISRLLARDPDARYPSAAAALHDLRRKRVRTSWRRFRVAGAVCVMGLLLVAWWWSTRSNELRLAADGVWGLRATDAYGSTLWTRPDTPVFTAAVVRRGNVREVAAILTPNDARKKLPEVRRRLSFLDPRTGRVLRSRVLPSETGAFPDHSDRFGVAQVIAVDTDADGYDEIVVAYSHDYWPSYIVLHDLRRDQSRLVFVAAGHHRIEGTADVDGDGIAELIISGTANRQGWYRSVAAIRVRLDGSPYEHTAYTPESFNSVRGASLLWYALCPPGALQRDGFIIDETQKVIRFTDAGGSIHDLTFDGFIRGTSSPLSASARQVARHRAYQHLRDATRYTKSEFPDKAVQAADVAYALARQAADPSLAEWSLRVKAMALIYGRRFEEATALLESVARNSIVAPDVSHDAATAFHLIGELPRALPWYRRSLGHEGRPWVGRLKYEALQGLVIALGEMGRWAEAEREVDQWAAAYPDEARAARWYRHYVAWRLGRVASAEYNPDEPTDPYRYWGLEIELARNRDPLEMLKKIDEDRLKASETRRVLATARAEALRRGGRAEEALQVARDAYAELRASRREWVFDRGHFDLAASRLAQLAEGHGLQDEAKRVRTEAAALRWHPTGMTR